MTTRRNRDADPAVTTDPGSPSAGRIGPRRGQPGPPADPMPAIGWIDRPGGWLRWGRWDPSGPARAVCLLFPGRTEYLERYDGVAARLTARGHAVVALDWFGQGLSGRPLADPRRHHIVDWADQARDIDRVVAAAGLADATVAGAAPLPVWALSHSMGGTVLALRLAAADPFPVPLQAAVMVAPLFGIYGLTGVTGQAAECLARTGAALGLSRRWAPSQGPWSVQREGPFEDNPLTHDRVRYDRRSADLSSVPGLAIGGVTWGWLASLFALFRFFEREGFGRIAVPVTLIAGAEERVVDNAAIHRAAQAMPHADPITVPGARHEVLMETDDLSAPAWTALLAIADGVTGAGGEPSR